MEELIKSSHHTSQYNQQVTTQLILK